MADQTLEERITQLEREVPLLKLSFSKIPREAKIYDITRKLTPTLAVWPGDTPYQFSLAWKMSAGASVNVGAVTMSLHTGTHTDAPFHFRQEGQTIDEIDLNVFIGPARVLDVSGKNLIEISDLTGQDLAASPRLLLRTGGWPDDTRFPAQVPTLAPDVPEFLAQQGIKLLGLDVPSVDQIASNDLPIHHALAAHKIAILESLDLSGVPEGVYELIALPLRIVGGDASPVRAILRG